ncbi:YbjN domain-containing protein [Erythrobacter sp.]|uniref:YbjN domain-containing protein n=1 Tax=Erythrobacter sp. TaxID=1042 RepID=UPI001425E19A|nr:YbjN domain-containing protein [Erythrobacter sp.]QIQ85877.1 MAG: YbjN domain-containing protein [Erythrobacter sp.]
MILRPLLALAALVAPFPLAAEETAERMISAERPEDMVIALLNAGYDPELIKDGVGDPAISFSRAEGYPLMVLFYDCDEETHDKCTSIQLRGGLDRAEPWNPAEAIEISSRYRFLAVSLDEEGDPWMTWDILTGNGIPESLFVEAVERFEATLEEAADALVFAEEREAEIEAAASAAEAGG